MDSRGRVPRASFRTHSLESRKSSVNTNMGRCTTRASYSPSPPKTTLCGFILHAMHALCARSARQAARLTLYTRGSGGIYSGPKVERAVSRMLCTAASDSWHPSVRMYVMSPPSHPSTPSYLPKHQKSRKFLLSPKQHDECQCIRCQ